MARKRFVTSEISTDRKIAKLAEKNPVAAALWPWFITALDDWGRMNAETCTTILICWGRC